MLYKMSKVVLVYLTVLISITNANFGVPTYKINLDEPPAKRWVQVCQDYDTEL